MAHQYTSEEARKARWQKGARYSHAAVRADGREPGEEARQARRDNAMRRRLMKALDAAPDEERVNSGDSYAEQLRKIARAENQAPDADDADAGVILDGID